MLQIIYTCKNIILWVLIQKSGLCFYQNCFFSEMIYNNNFMGSTCQPGKGYPYGNIDQRTQGLD